MAKILDIDKLRPHRAGMVDCVSCGHTWVAVIPVSDMAPALECPSCGKMKGQFRARPWQKKNTWTCTCGNDLFQITPDGIYCPDCGDWQDPYSKKA